MLQALIQEHAGQYTHEDNSSSEGTGIYEDTKFTEVVDGMEWQVCL